MDKLIKILPSLLIILTIVTIIISIKINQNNKKIEELTENKEEISIKYLKFINQKLNTIIIIKLIPYIIIALFLLKVINVENNNLPKIINININK